MHTVRLQHSPLSITTLGVDFMYLLGVKGEITPYHNAKYVDFT